MSENIRWIMPECSCCKMSIWRCHYSGRSGFWTSEIPVNNNNMCLCGSFEKLVRIWFGLPQRAFEYFLSGLLDNWDFKDVWEKVTGLSPLETLHIVISYTAYRKEIGWWWWGVYMSSYTVFKNFYSEKLQI